jgi:uncharacterized protein (DUF697 family)/GTPase SAR1 family protein
MEINTDQVVQDCFNAIREKVQNLTTLNIIVAGKTGVGKSTLINSVFRENLAETGMGRPVTTHMRRITKKDFPLVVYDTRGFELGKSVQEDVKEEVMKTIRDGLACNDISKAIHCIWYCINAASNRIEPEEIEWLRELGAENEMTQVPIIVVLTQCFSKKKAQEMRKAVEDENLNVVQIVPVLAQDYEIDEEYVAKAFGLDVLIRVMSEALPDELLDTLQNLQKVSLDEKTKRAQAAVATATAAAAAAGATPIPIADCAVLIPTQVAMIASIAVIFGIDINKTVLASFVSSVLGTGGATLLGKTVVSNVLKLIPGAGSVAGGAISGATAGLLTTALGETFILVMTQIYKGELTTKDLESSEGKKIITAIFKDQLKHSR